MRILRLVLSYDGTDFYGWQIQPQRRTIQGEIESALSTILNEPVRIVGAGRTDRGVHATGQVASVETERSIPARGLERALNALLPASIQVEAVEEAEPGFHARHSALSRVYVYKICRVPTPFQRRYAWCLPEAPAEAELSEASRVLLGRHPFDSFSSGEGLDGSTLCHVQSLDWYATGDLLIMKIEADRFLYRMVRTIVGSLVQLHKAKSLDSGAVRKLLEGRCHTPFAVPAPPGGLFLERVRYPVRDLQKPPVTG
jgi:tRNA pseudouridine38-40 synthase